MNDTLITIIALIIVIGSVLFPIITYEHKERKKVEKYIKEHPDFIKVKEIGIKEAHLGLPTVLKAYGSEYIICPKCKSKDTYYVYGPLGTTTYICRKCHYQK